MGKRIEDAALPETATLEAAMLFLLATAGRIEQGDITDDDGQWRRALKLLHEFDWQLDIDKAGVVRLADLPMANWPGGLRQFARLAVTRNPRWILRVMRDSMYPVLRARRGAPSLGADALVELAE